MSDLSKIELLTNVEKVNDPRHLDMHSELRRKLEEGNLLEYWTVVDVTTHATPNTEFMVDCTPFDRTPKYYFIIKKDKAVDIYTGATAWAKNKLYLKASVASATIKLLVVG